MRHVPRTPNQRPPGRAPASRPLPLWAPLVLLGAWFGAADAAQADGCAGCAPPAVTELRSDPGFRLETRKGFPDTLHLDAGECVGRLEGEPEVTVEDAWLVLRGQGEVWNCPHSQSVDTVTITTSASDRSDWTLRAKLGAELVVLGVKLKAEAEAGRTTGTTVTEVTQVAKQIRPSTCHRIAWQGFFEVVRLRAVGHYRFERRWAWWTKNFTTGATVHARGEIWVDCGGGALEMQRKAPIAGHFALQQRGCDEPECAHVMAKSLGMFPPFSPPGAGDEDGPDPTADGAPAGDGLEDEPQDPRDEPHVPGDEPLTSGDLPDPPAGDCERDPGEPPASDPVAAR